MTETTATQDRTNVTAKFLAGAMNQVRYPGCRPVAFGGDTVYVKATSVAAALCGVARAMEAIRRTTGRRNNNLARTLVVKIGADIIDVDLAGKF